MSSESGFFYQNHVRRRSPWIGPLALLLVFVVIILFISLVYRVRKIEVVNASEYTDAQIIAASGIQTGGNLFFMDRFTAASLIFSNLHYMEEVSIQRKLPDTIVIQAKGTAASAWMEVGGECWLIDRVGVMLEPVSPTEAQSYTEIRGLETSSPLEGEPMLVDDANAGRLQATCALLTALIGEDMLKDVSYIDVTKPEAPVFAYQGRLTVYPGDVTEADYVMALFKDAVSKLSPGDTGILTNSGDGKWTYSPD